MIIYRTYKALNVCEHVFGAKKLAYDSTCSKEGQYVKTCVQCGKQVTITIPKKDHEWVSDDGTPLCLYEGVNATCAVCGEHTVTEERTEHDYNGLGICRNCNAIYDDSYITFVLLNKSYGLILSKTIASNHIHYAAIKDISIERRNGEYPMTISYNCDQKCDKCEGRPAEDNVPNLNIYLYNADKKLVGSYPGNALLNDKEETSFEIQANTHFGYDITRYLDNDGGRIVSSTLNKHGHLIYYIELDSSDSDYYDIWDKAGIIDNGYSIN